MLYEARFSVFRPVDPEAMIQLFQVAQLWPRSKSIFILSKTNVSPGLPGHLVSHGKANNVSSSSLAPQTRLSLKNHRKPCFFSFPLTNIVYYYNIFTVNPPNSNYYFYSITIWRILSSGPYVFLRQTWHRLTRDLRLFFLMVWLTGRENCSCWSSMVASQNENLLAK